MRMDSFLHLPVTADRKGGAIPLLMLSKRCPLTLGLLLGFDSDASSATFTIKAAAPGGGLKEIVDDGRLTRRN
jgi:hypothetical protein